MEFADIVKSRIKELIEYKGMSIYELANKADLTEACIRNWYTKRNYTPSLDAIFKICQACNISVSKLLLDEQEELYPVSIEERRLLDNWIYLNEAQKKLIFDLIAVFINSEQ